MGTGQVAILPNVVSNLDQLTVGARLDPETGLGEIPTFWFAAREVGTILVRGYQLDGDGVMRFNEGRDRVTSTYIFFSQQGTALGMPQGWVHEPDIWLYVDNSGCYAIDILGARGYRDRLIIKVARS